ncbi:hypothetical protein [Psychromonas arctica]|uniref:hypothetical protein n=1 Tax=Psychromonas arctica TaxID=168275 RepID=UPI00048FFA83|nr:hypothetical protein [Psychromonas arctica]
MAHDLALIGALYGVRKYGDYSALVSLFEKSPMLVIGDEVALEYIIELIKQSPKLKRPSTLYTPDNISELDFFVSRVWAYHFLGVQLYSKYEDEKNIQEENPPHSAIDRVFRWGKLRGSKIGYSKLQKKISLEKKKLKKGSKKVGEVAWTKISILMFELYRDEKDSLDLSKGKLNAIGTYFDPIECSIWQELEEGPRSEVGEI